VPPAEEAMTEEERGEIDRKLERLDRRRAQIGPVNPLAEREYEEASDHVEQLQAQREDTERAMRELESLIREIDDEIERAFEETFEATATNFEEMVEHLFPGGRGRLRRVSLRAVREEEAPQAAESEDAAEAEEPDPDEEEREERDEFGVEIEVNPAGKSTRKLSLMSGGEKSLVALAFVFAVFLARPCPFYILDEVEAALDDANIDRFLQLIRRFSDRAQFVIVTHQKRTMDAADVLYGVTMGGDGVTKVVSRKLPRDRTEDDADSESDGPEALTAVA
jgi:chromosome segregation protein